MTDLLALGLSLATALTVVAGWFRWVLPRYRRWRGQFVAARDSIIGRPAELDSITGTELAPALPGVGVRLEALERHLGVLADAVKSLAQSHVQLEDHEDRIQKLEIASVERIVTRVDSAAGWRAMEEAVKAQPDREGAEGSS